MEEAMGALSVTGTEHYRTPFEPLIPGVKFAKYNDLDSVKALVSDKTKACSFAGGIRILRQDSWEALSSFIISQNNNIPRIKGHYRTFV